MCEVEEQKCCELLIVGMMHDRYVSAITQRSITSLPCRFTVSLGSTNAKHLSLRVIMNLDLQADSQICYYCRCAVQRGGTAPASNNG